MEQVKLMLAALRSNYLRDLPSHIDELEELISQESAYIDARVSVKYATPILSESYPNAFLILKRICIFRVSDRVRNIIEIKMAA